MYLVIGIEMITLVESHTEWALFEAKTSTLYVDSRGGAGNPFYPPIRETVRNPLANPQHCLFKETKMLLQWSSHQLKDVLRMYLEIDHSPIICFKSSGTTGSCLS